MKIALVPANTPFPRFFPDPWPYPEGSGPAVCREMAAEGQTTTLRRQLTIRRALGYCRLMPGVMAANKAATLSGAPALISGLSRNHQLPRFFLRAASRSEVPVGF